MHLLLVEDDRIIRITVRDALADAGYAVTDVADGVAAAREMESHVPDLVLTDVRLPGLDGISLFRRAQQLRPSPAVVLMTAYADTEDAVAVMREGARDYLLKPFEMDELLLRLGRVRDELELRRRMAEGGPAGPKGLADLILGDTPAIRLLRDRVEAAAESDVPVLITGETGTGKDLAAQAIHDHGRRSGRPFVAVNCAAMPETLFEAEMFGHEKGAFTGAEQRRVGRFEAADGGTLFLDEVGELSLANQAKLLRALERKSVEPLGASRSVKVDVRVLAATNRDLVAEIERGTFRKDLYYRLNVIDVRSPSLRERRADIPAFVGRFLTDIAARQGRARPELEPSAAAALATHDYPGNVRELQHALERAVALSRGRPIALEHLPDEIVRASRFPRPQAAPPADAVDLADPPPLGQAREQFEREYIERVLERTGGHKGRAAALLGISRKSLWERLKEPRATPPASPPTAPRKP